MVNSSSDLWWLQVVRGITAIGFGVLMLVWPTQSIFAVTIMFAALFTVFAITDIIHGVTGLAKNFSSILRLILGVLEIGIVVYLFKNAGSGMTMALIGLLMAVAVLAMAFALLASALLSDAPAGSRWAMGILAVITFFIGVTVFRAPALSYVTLVYVLAVFGLFTGPIEIATGLMLKKETAK